MSDQSAIRLLQTAIEQVRDQCDGPEYKSLLAACDAADSAASKAVSEDKTDRPRTLKGATTAVRVVFAQDRKAASADGK